MTAGSTSTSGCDVRPAGSASAAERAEVQVKFVRIKRVLITAATAFLSINLWTGAPLFALWVGSQAAGEKLLSMTAIGIVVVTLATLVALMSVALVRLNEIYKRITGHRLGENRMTWLRAYNAHRETVGEGLPISLLERIVMWNVYIAVIALIAYWIAVPQSPLPH
jgi:hypothetical protein